MTGPIVFMFSGQGSQYYHMGKELFENNDVFRNSMLELDALSINYTGQSIIAEIYNPQKNLADKFNRLKYTHPAIFMVEYSLYQVLVKMGIKPDYFLGSSLGEYTCFAVTGILSVQDAFECIMKQADLIESCCDAGGMMTIVEKPDLYYDTPLLSEYSELASINYDRHFVISGQKEKLNFIADYLQERNILYQILPIDYGFHSFYIDAAHDKYMEFLETKILSRAFAPYLSCMMGKQVEEVSVDFLWDVIRKPVLFQKTVQCLQEISTCIYIDAGLSGTLANFTKYNISGDNADKCYSIMTPFHQERKNLVKLETYKENHNNV